VDGCRKRTTPPSLRFLGRKVYLATVVTLISAMLHGTTPARLMRLSIMPGIDRRTLARWRAWWLSTFTDGPFALALSPMPAGLRPDLSAASPLALLALCCAPSLPDLLMCFIPPVSLGLPAPRSYDQHPLAVRSGQRAYCAAPPTRNASTPVVADSSPVWASLHGTVTLCEARPRFPWPYPASFVRPPVLPLAQVTLVSTTRQLRFSITTSPMWHSLAAAPIAFL